MHSAQLQLQYSQLQAQNTQLAAEHKHLQSQFSVNLNSSLKPKLTHLTATHEALQAQCTQLQSQSQPHDGQTVQQLTDTDIVTALQAHIALEVTAAVNQKLQQLRTSEPAHCEGDLEPTEQQTVLDPDIQSNIESTVNLGLSNWYEEIKQRILDWSTAEAEITKQRVQQQVQDYLAALQNDSGSEREHTAQLSNEQQTDLQSAQCISGLESYPTSVAPGQSEMTAVQQYLQTQISELEAERAVTAQQVKAQIQSALSKQQ